MKVIKELVGSLFELLREVIEYPINSDSETEKIEGDYYDEH